MATHHALQVGDEDGGIVLITTYEASLILNRAPDTVRGLARRGTLPAAISTKAGRLFRRQDVERLATQMRRPTGTPGR